MHVKVFFNCRIITSDSNSLGSQFSAVGNWCLTPVRYLFKGKRITLFDQPFDIISEKDDQALNKTTAIVLLIVGLIFGILFKGVSYLSPTVRENHQHAVKHLSPLKRVVIGDAKNKLSRDQVKRAVEKFYNDNTHHQTVNHMVIYASSEITRSLYWWIFENINPKDIQTL